MYMTVIKTFGMQNLTYCLPVKTLVQTTTVLKRCIHTFYNIDEEL